MRQLGWFGLLCLLFVPATQAATPIWQLVPEETMAVVVFPDLGKTRAAFKETGLYKMCSEGGLGKLVDTLLEPFAGKRKELEEQIKETIGISLADALGLLNGEVGVAVVHVGAEGPGEGPPAFLVSFEFGKNLATMQTLMERFIKSGPGRGEHKVVTTDHKGASIITIQGKGGPPLVYTLHEGRALMSLDAALITGAIDRAQGAGGTHLGQSAGMKGALAALTPNGTDNILLHVNLASAKKLYGKAIPEQVDSIIKALGVDNWQSVSYVGRFEGNQIADVMHLQTDGDPKGLIKLLTPHTMEAAPKAIPAGAASYGVTRFDLAGIYTGGLDILKAIDRETYGKVTEQIAAWEEKSQFKIAPFLGSIGTRAEVISWMPSVGLFPQGVVKVDLKDAEAFLAGYAKLGSMFGMEHVSEAYKGRTLHHLRSKLGQFGKPPIEMGDEKGVIALIAGSMLPAYYTIEPGDTPRLVVAGMQQTLQDYIDGAGQQGSAQPLPALPDGLVAMSTGDDAKMMVGLYNTALPVLVMLEGVIRMFGVNYDSRYLPRARTLLKHLAPSLMTLRRTASGVTLHSKTSIGSVGVGVAAVGIGAAIAIPAVLKVRERAKEAQSRNNLRQIGLGLILYRDAHRNRFPPHDKLLETLFTSGTLPDAEVYICPLTDAGPRAVRIGKDGKPMFYTSYIARPTPITTSRGSSEQMVVWTRTFDGRFGESRIVLFLDGHVETLDEDEFQTKLAALTGKKSDDDDGDKEDKGGDEKDDDK